MLTYIKKISIHLPLFFAASFLNICSYNKCHNISAYSGRYIDSNPAGFSKFLLIVYLDLLFPYQAPVVLANASTAASVQAVLATVTQQVS